MDLPNILLVVLDGVRMRNTSLGGYQRETTPGLERFETNATHFKRAIAPSNWSLPSHTSIFTGYEVPEHRITVQYDTLEPGHTIWERLRDEWGYSTALFSQNEFLTADQYGLNEGFETITGPVTARTYPFNSGYRPKTFRFESPELSEWFRRGISTGSIGRTMGNYVAYTIENVAKKIETEGLRWRRLPVRQRYRSPARVHTERFIDWMLEEDGPWAACLNYMDANTMHVPWSDRQHWSGKLQERLRREFDNMRWDVISGRQPWWKLRALQACYDDAVELVDGQFERLIDELRQRSEFDNTMIVVTADHGDGLGERSQIRPGMRIAAHSAGLHECLLHVPLLVKLPRQSRPVTIRTPVSLSEFPRVVEEVIEGSPPTDAFVRNKPVLAASYHDRLYEYVVQNEEWGIGRYLDDLDLTQFKGTARTVYKKEDDLIIKYATWGDDEAVLRIPQQGREQAVRIGTEASGAVERAFSGLSDREVHEQTETLESVDKSVLERLTKLGYR